MSERLSAEDPYLAHVKSRTVEELAQELMSRDNVIRKTQSDIASLTRQIEAADTMTEDVGQVLGRIEPIEDSSWDYGVDRYSIENMQHSHDTYRAASDEEDG